MKKLEQLLSKQGLTEEEAVTAFKQLLKPENKRIVHVHEWSPKRGKLGIFSDTHMGSKFFNPSWYDFAVRTFDREKVDAVYHAGDVIEGMSNREGHIYELAIPGVSAQMDYACELLYRIKQPFFFITGNHDAWAMNKGNQGFDVGQTLEERLPNAHYLGSMRADVKLADNVMLGLSHEGNSSYALSYSGQKRINALEGGTKPNILVNGHIHKALYMMYRNIHYFEASTLQSQTPFMAMKGSPAMCGFWTIEYEINKGNLASISPKFYPFY